MTNIDLKVGDDRAPAGVTGLRPWLIWALGSASFGLAFFQRVAPSVMVEDLMRDLAVGAAVLGNLSAIYLLAYAGLQVPIGMMLDRLGPRRMLAGAALVAAAGALLFGLANGVALAFVGRFLIGAGSAVGLIGTMKLVSHWFPPARFATVSGLIMPFAMIGGVLGQAPFSLVVEAVGWRGALYLTAALAGLLAIATWLVVRDRPQRRQVEPAAPAAKSRIGADLIAVLGSGRNWALAIYAGAMSGPMLAYAALWGVPHLMTAYGLSRPQAGLTTSLMLVGGALGGPVGGRLSDYLARRKAPMVGAAGVALGAWLIIVYVPDLPYLVVAALLPVAGMTAGFMVIAYATAREISPARVTGAAVGFVNTAAVGAGALLQPIIGVLLDAGWDGTEIDGVRQYSLATYETAFVTLPACGLLALASALAVRETHARPLEER